jgi:tRNA(fMet)-specific endonuclease VapC
LTRYMLDTNVIFDLIRNPQGKAAKRIAKVGDDNICTSIIVAAELRYGCAKSGSERLLKAVEDLLAEIDVLPFDVPADAEYGGIRAELEAAGKPIGENDFLIAAHGPGKMTERAFAPGEKNHEAMMRHATSRGDRYHGYP